MVRVMLESCIDFFDQCSPWFTGLFVLISIAEQDNSRAARLIHWQPGQWVTRNLTYHVHGPIVIAGSGWPGIWPTTGSASHSRAKFKVSHMRKKLRTWHPTGWVQHYNLSHHYSHSPDTLSRISQKHTTYLDCLYPIVFITLVILWLGSG